MYLRDWCLTPYLRIFHFYNGGQYNGLREPASTRAEINDLKLLQKLYPRTTQKEIRHELGLNSL